MDWTQIRAHYARLFEESGLTQEQVAKAVRTNQNVVSKLLANTKRGPTVLTFVNAVLGLGIPPSAFFAQLERQLGMPPSSDLTSPVAPLVVAENAREASLFRALFAAARAFQAEAADPHPLRRRPRAKRRRTKRGR